MGSWDIGEYCPQCVIVIDENADSARCEVISNRMSFKNDNGTELKLDGRWHTYYGGNE